MSDDKNSWPVSSSLLRLFVCIGRWVSIKILLHLFLNYLLITIKCNQNCCSTMCTFLFLIHYGSYTHLPRKPVQRAIWTTYVYCSWRLINGDGMMMVKTISGIMWNMFFRILWQPWLKLLPQKGEKKSIRNQ